MNQIDWSKAPEGADKYNTFNKRFYRGKRPQLDVFNEISEEWQASDLLVQNENFVQRPDEPYTWNGDGLPPVGTACEVNYQEWRRCDVFAHKVEGDNDPDVLFSYTKDNGDPAWNWVRDPSRFRPIRTPEQIAAEEREKVIEQMMEDYKYKEGPCTHHLLRSQAERIYDAGYRKVEGGEA